MAYSATSTEALLLAIDDFVDESIVVPPGEIDHRSLISVDDIKKALRRRKKRKEEFQKLHEESDLSDAYGKFHFFESVLGTDGKLLTLCHISLLQIVTTIFF